MGIVPELIGILDMFGKSKKYDLKGSGIAT
jgi:hypothetical protein